jgi:predicted RND superfamily exporter protein
MNLQEFANNNIDMTTGILIALLIIVLVIYKKKTAPKVVVPMSATVVPLSATSGASATPVSESMANLPSPALGMGFDQLWGSGSSPYSAPDAAYLQILHEFTPEQTGL